MLDDEPKILKGNPQRGERQLAKVHRSIDQKIATGWFGSTPSVRHYCKRALAALPAFVAAAVY